MEQQQATNGVKISKLEAKAFKRITEVVIEPSQSMVVIQGNNANGKSSVLDSIAAALGGAKLNPVDPIKHGERHASAKVTLSDGMVVERTWSIKRDGGVSSKLEVTSPEGEVLPSPQAVLDKLIGKLSFDPEAFLREESKKQLDTLKTIAGVDFADLDAKHAKLYAERTEVGRELKSAESALLSMPYPQKPGPRIEVADLIAEQKAAREVVAQIRRATDDLAACEQHHQKRLTDIDRLRNELAEAERVLKNSEQQLEAARMVHKAQPEMPNLAAIDAKIVASADINRKIDEANRVIAERERQSKMAQELAAQQQKLTDEIGSLQEAREMRVKAARIPVDGLGFGIDGVLYNGVPLEQASSAEQLRVSLAMGMALNPALRVIQIRNGSLLDEHSMAVVRATAESNDFQIFVERVGKSGHGGVVIQDGLVEEPEQLPDIQA